MKRSEAPHGDLGESSFPTVRVTPVLHLPQKFLLVRRRLRRNAGQMRCLNHPWVTMIGNPELHGA